MEPEHLMQPEAPKYLRDLASRDLTPRVTPPREGPSLTTPVRKRVSARPVREPTRENFPGEHNSWKLARRRCTTPTEASYRYYGGKGVTFHPEWMSNETGFAAFLRDMGPKPNRAYLLGRRDKSGNYDPDNCFWLLRSDVRLGLRKNAEHAAVQVVVETTGRKDTQKQVALTERSGLILIDGMKLSPNQADAVALALVRFADAIRRRRQ